MTRIRIAVNVLAAGLACLVACAREPAASATGIPENTITELQKDLVEAGRESSSTRKRRGYKNLIRDGEHLFETSPAAANRWLVLETVFQGRKRLLGLENSGRNREALFSTCAKLAEAPDALAHLRLEADMLLMERDLSRNSADVKERAEVLVKMIARYRDTPAEAKCLIIAAQIAPKLDAFELEKKIHRTLEERCAGDLDVIEWHRKHRDFSHLPVQFAGTFTRSDGTALSFPVDRLGHTFVIDFWSRGTPELQAHFDEIKDLQARFPGRFEVFSVNVDELSDAGEGIVRARGLDWTSLRLPRGRKSQVYRAYAGRDPLAIRVNAHGHAFISASRTKVIAEEAPMEQNFDDPRYHAQLQSLLAGEFLLDETPPDNPTPRTPESVPAEMLDAIQACFIVAPFRYRLTHAEALANYKQAETFCRNAIAKYPGAPDLWRVRNRQIVALLGMWNLAAEPKHLEAAVKEARAALTATPPRGSDIVPRFCLAKETLRRVDSNPRLVLSGLVEATGAGDAPASAHAAAAILAIDANDRDLHARYRQKLLETPNDDPALWPVVSFLRDQNHRYRLFKPNLYHPPSLARRIERARLRSNAAALDQEHDTGAPMQAELKTLDGDTLNLPQATDDKWAFLMFVEPAADPAAEFPVVIKGEVTEDSRGRKRETKGVMQNAFEFAAQHPQQRVKVIAAFLSDDTARVRILMNKLQWPCQAVTVPGGLGNPLVRRLGILSADRVPNIVLLRPDASIAWKLSGIVHPQVRSEGIGELIHVISRAMEANIERYEEE
jgi:hypothetical protein